MILTCPDCSTRYHVDPTSLSAGGRKVRCANCGHRWSARPPEDAPQVVDLAVAADAPRRPGAVIGADQDRGSRNLIAWLALVLVVLVLAGAVIGRNEIAQVLPASAGVYQTLGLPVTLRLDLKLENVTSERLEERGLSILVVQGEIVNRAGAARDVPPIKVTLLDDSGRQLQHELFEADDARLAPDQRTSFSARLVNPTEQARNFSVTFDLP